jgi:hypothetical protein
VLSAAEESCMDAIVMVILSTAVLIAVVKLR